MKMKKLGLKVSGMHCKSCEVLLKDALVELGVKECSADHVSGRVVVVFDESKLDIGRIAGVIKKEGYKVEV